MKRIEKNYIKIEFGTATWGVDLNQAAESDILDEGIDCYTDDVYEILYEDGYNITDEKLRMLLNEPDNSENMLYPLDCQRDLSFDDWLEYKEMRDKEIEEAIKMRVPKKLPTKKAPTPKVPRKK